MSAMFAIGGDLPVRRLGFGAMRLGRSDHDVPRRAVELGVQLIDTARFYGEGANEELIAEALHPYPDDLVVATKVGIRHGGAEGWEATGRPEQLRQQVQDGLRRLRVDRLDLLQLHRLDPEVALAEQVSALAAMRDEGLIRHIGLSEVSVDQLDQALEIAPVASVQNRYSLFDRSHEAVLERCAAGGIAFLPWRPVANARELPEVAAVAGELGATTTQIALAWLLAHSPVVLPIPGTTSVPHLEENLGAGDMTLSPEQYARLTNAETGPG